MTSSGRGQDVSVGYPRFSGQSPGVDGELGSIDPTHIEETRWQTVRAGIPFL